MLLVGVGGVIHYHGTPISGPIDAAARFMAGRHLFVSHAAPEQLEMAAEAGQSFALDNGAFSAWRAGRPMDVAAYRDWVSDWYRHPGCDWHVIPDVIDGDERDNRRAVEDWPFPSHASVPVWHMDKSTAYLLWLARNFPRVAIGSSGQWPTPGVGQWWDRMAVAMSAVCDEHGRPMCKLHGLRMLDPEIFARLPLASADSTNAARNAGHTTSWTKYRPREAWQRAGVIADRIEAINSAPTWVGSEQLCIGF